MFPGYSIAKENISSDKFSIILSSCYDLGVSCLLLASFYILDVIYGTGGEKVPASSHCDPWKLQQLA